MQRRKFLIASGALAAGGAAGLGTGAFNQVSAERTVTVDVAGDSNALLGLDASLGQHSSLSEETANGEVQVDIDGEGTDANGINANGTTILFELFQVKNNGTEPAIVYVNPDSVTIDGNKVPGQADDYIDPQATNRPYDSGVWTDDVPYGYDAVSMTAAYIPADGNEQVNPPHFASEADTVFGQGNGRTELRLDVGQAFQFGLYIEEDGNGSFGDVSLELVADTGIA